MIPTVFILEELYCIPTVYLQITKNQENVSTLGDEWSLGNDWSIVQSVFGPWKVVNIFSKDLLDLKHVTTWENNILGA